MTIEEHINRAIYYKELLKKVVGIPKELLGRDFKTETERKERIVLYKTFDEQWLVR